MTRPKIEGYRLGEIVVDGRRYRRDVIVLPDRVLPDWRRLQGHSLAVEDLDEVLGRQPQVLVVGQGAYSRMRVPAGTQREIEAAGIQLIIHPTAEACETYNQLRDRVDVAAALHLTC
jgi:hypothetical protein